jgi:hypothetical protein
MVYHFIELYSLNTSVIHIKLLQMPSHIMIFFYLVSNDFEAVSNVKLWLTSSLISSPHQPFSLPTKITNIKLWNAFPIIK